MENLESVKSIAELNFKMYLKRHIHDKYILKYFTDPYSLYAC